MESKIKLILKNLGSDLCGIANVDRFNSAPEGFHPKDLYADCKSAIVFAKAVPKGLINVDPKFIYNNIKDVCIKEIDRIAYLAALEIEEMDGMAVPLPCNTPYEYWNQKNMEGKGLLSMKHAAVLAGLGSLGKNTLLVNKKYGNMINVGVILTNLDLVSDPISEDLCIRDCKICIDNCPAGAIKKNHVEQKLCRKESSGITEKGFEVTLCNKCRTLCPMKIGG